MAALLQQGTTSNRDKLGEVTWTRKWVVDTEAECETAGDSSYLGLPEDSRSSSQLNNGRHELTVSYKGLRSDTDESKERWSGRITLREVPIEAHPNFKQLLTIYGGQLDEKEKVTWPQYMPSSKNGNSTPGRNASGDGSQTPNPMFGNSTYPEASGEIKHTYLRKSLPQDLLGRIGQVREELPGNSGIPTPEGFVWLTDCPEFDRDVGEAWTIVDSYKLTRKDSALHAINTIMVR